MSEPIVGLDVGGSKIAALLVDDDAAARGAVLVARAGQRASLP